MLKQILLESSAEEGLIRVTRSFSCKERLQNSRLSTPLSLNLFNHNVSRGEGCDVAPSSLKVALKLSFSNYALRSYFLGRSDSDTLLQHIRCLACGSGIVGH